ncbi:hydantoinase B/oxoprolinase family protein [Conexibacter sp. SYSU D00693]|uniref:hydantoinase B/oxoprolinase family protein n=1 Tax=Conexibacter sp. SYSU D00693 TaxID=2812560 RepID=UPI00196B3649|nr:hydantoinase B/oxoprolinase family protein [Conexibacter sp. SYSU D00693]
MNPPPETLVAPGAPAATDREAQAEAFFRELLDERPVMYGPSAAIIDDNRLSPRSAADERALASVSDGVEVTIAQNRLEVILESAKEMLEQTGAAPGAKWGDLTCGLYSAAGDLALASSSGVVVFAACASAPVKHIVKDWIDEPTVGVRPGDVFYHNDARYGGVHNADQSLFIPIFVEGELIAWAGATIHEGENGATEPGGLSPSALSVYDEGLKISPVKVAEDYTFRRDLVNLLQNNVRDPLMQLIDMRAKLAACMRIEERVKEVVADRSPDLVLATLRLALERTRDEVKRRFTEMPDGIFRTVCFCDTTLLEDRLLKMVVELDKRGDKVVCRTHGTGPAILDRAINMDPTFARALFSNNLMNFFWPDLPRNAGYVSAIEFEFEEGSVAKSGAECPNALSMIAACFFQTGMHVCMSKLAYNRPGDIEVIAPWYGMTQSMFYGGLNQWGMPVANLMIDINSMGGGAHADRDGEHSCAPFFAAMADYGEIEDRETELPILAIGRNLNKDNHGYGRHRGGSSVECMYMVWGVPEFALGTLATGSKFPTIPGLFGGYGGPSSPLTIFRADSSEAVKEALRERAHEVPRTADQLHREGGLPGTAETRRATQTAEFAKEGDLWILQVGGGGGYGDPLERDPQAVMKDLREERISAWVAERVYHVVYDAEHLRVDAAATEAARDAERAARKARSLPYEEFVAQWRRDEPPANVPFLGSWDWGTAA